MKYPVSKLSNGDPEKLVGEERRWILWFALFIMLITTIPYLIGFSAQGDHWVFSGFLFGVEDGNSYIAKMLSGSAGAWLFRTPYTAVEQQGVLAFFPYILFGKLAAGPEQHLQLVVLFHLYRIFAGVFAIFATYRFLSIFVQGIFLRRIGTALAVLGGGLGWILVLLGRENWLGSLPLDFYSPETFGFLSFYGLPHLAMARGLLLMGLVAYLRNEVENGSDRFFGRFTRGGAKGIKVGVIWLVLGLFQPLTIVIGWVVMGAHLGVGGGLLLWRIPQVQERAWRKWLEYLKNAIISILVSSPLVLYIVIVFNSDPFLRTWTAQNLILSPHPFHYLVAYGLLLPYIVVGIRRIRLENFQESLPIAWAAMMPFLAYAPYNLQRRLPEGVWVALIALALYALDTPRLSGLSKANRHSKALYPLIFLFPSTFLLLGGGILGAVNPSFPAFRRVTQVRAFKFLAAQADTGDVILTSFATGNALPAWAPVRVIVGHGPESVFLEELEPRVEMFFRSDTPDVERQSLLSEFDVQYVYWGDGERALGDWDPRQGENLYPIYEASGDIIFEVRD